MKKLILAAVAAVTLTGCIVDAELDPNIPDKNILTSPIIEVFAGNVDGVDYWFDNNLYTCTTAFIYDNAVPGVVLSGTDGVDDICVGTLYGLTVNTTAEDSLYSPL